MINHRSNQKVIVQHQEEMTKSTNSEGAEVIFTALGNNSNNPLSVPYRHRCAGAGAGDHGYRNDQTDTGADDFNVLINPPSYQTTIATQVSYINNEVIPQLNTSGDEMDHDNPPAKPSSFHPYHHTTGIDSSCHTSSINEIRDDDDNGHGRDKQGDKTSLRPNETDRHEDDNILSSSSILAVTSSSPFHEDSVTVKTSAEITQGALEINAMSNLCDYSTSSGLTSSSSSDDPVPPTTSKMMLFHTLSDDSCSSSKEKSSSKSLIVGSSPTISARPQRPHSDSFSSCCSSYCLENAPCYDHCTSTNGRSRRNKRNTRTIHYNDTSNSTIPTTFYFNEKDHPAKAASIKLRYHKQWEEFLKTHHEEYFKTRSKSQKKQLLSLISQTWNGIGGIFLSLQPLTDNMGRRVYYIETNTSIHDEITKKCLALLSARKKIAQKKQTRLSSPLQHLNQANLPQSPSKNDHYDNISTIQYTRQILDEDISCGGTGLVFVSEDNNNSESLGKYLDTPGVYLVNAGNRNMNKTSKRQKKRIAQESSKRSWSKKKEDVQINNSNTTKIYKARVNYFGVSVNLGSYQSSASAAAAVDISNVLFWGEDNNKPLYILSMNEVESSLKAVGITNIIAESERIRQKFDEERKAEFEQFIEAALLSIGGKDSELASIVCTFGQASNKDKCQNQTKMNKRKRIKSSDLLYDGEHVIYEVDNDGRFSWKKVNAQK